MSNALRKEIYQFLSNLPEWQKLLGAHLLGLTEKPLSQEGAIDTAYQILLHEHKLTNKKIENIKLNFPKIASDDERESNEIYTLNSISNVTNLNALSSDQSFKVANKGLTVVYGDNGVGKSGYGRLFNNAFYSRGDNFLIGNVYGPNKTLPSSAVFTFLDPNGNELKLNYPEQKNHPAFKQFSAFDSKSVNVHIDTQNELHVQPVELDFFEKLISLIKLVADKIQNESQKLNRSNILIPSFSEDSDIKQAITQITSKADYSKFEKLAIFSEEDQKKVNNFEKEKSNLSLTDIEKKKKTLVTIKNKISTLKTSITTLNQSLKNEKIDLFIKGIEKYENLKAEVEKNGIEQFSDPKFKGIGSETWQLFIKNGHELGKLNDDESSEYPHDGDSCPYCRQDLDDTAIALIQRYQSYLQSTAKEGIIKAEDWAKKQIKEIKALDIPALIEGDQFSEWCKVNQKEILEKIKASFKDLSEVKDGAIKSLTQWEKTSIQTLQNNEIEWEKLETEIQNEISALNEEKVSERLKNINKELIALNHRKILKNLLPEVKKFIDGLKKGDELDKLKRSISRTTTITNKATELHEKYISNRYIQLFKQECIDLKIPCPDLNPVGTKGKTKRKYSIVGEIPSKVLSEGEQRAVALADFFTEAKIGEMSGLIFDDPVNSQDHKRKDNIAKRIVTEAKNRQVIVLTHDLLFLNDLVGFSKEENVVIDSHWMDKRGPMETGVIHHSSRPDIDSDFTDAQVAKEKLAEAKEVISPKDVIRLTKDGLSNLRSSYESFIINVVFDKVVKRFERRIRQEGLTNVYAPKEKMEFIASKMALLSGYTNAHLQLDRNATDITTDILEKEIKEYEEFSTSFKSEKRKASKEFKVPPKELEITTAHH